jgi:hypothetical protein
VPSKCAKQIHGEMRLLGVRRERVAFAQNVWNVDFPMPKQLFLCLLLAALSFAAPLRPISIPTLLIQLNMTFSELFPAQLNSSDFVYTYSQSEARFKGPAYDGGTIDVVGCSGMKEDCPSGGGMVRQPFALAPHLTPPTSAATTQARSAAKTAAPAPAAHGSSPRKLFSTTCSTATRSAPWAARRAPIAADS